MARGFADDVIRPVAEALDRDERFPRKSMTRWPNWACSVSACPKRWAAPA